MILYILNRFTFRNAEGFLNPLAANGGFSSRAENEYRRVKMKYGRRKLEKMGLDPSKYSEDFIFALKITLTEVNAHISATALLFDAGGKPVPGAKVGEEETPMKWADLQKTKNYDKLAVKGAPTKMSTKGVSGIPLIGKPSSSILTIQNLCILVNYSPVVPGPKTTSAEAQISFWEVWTLYHDKSNLLFVCQWNPALSNMKLFNPTQKFGAIHGFNSTCRKMANATAAHGSVGINCGTEQFKRDGDGKIIQVSGPPNSRTGSSFIRDVKNVVCVGGGEASKVEVSELKK